MEIHFCRTSNYVTMASERLQAHFGELQGFHYLEWLLEEEGKPHPYQTSNSSKPTGQWQARPCSFFPPNDNIAKTFTGVVIQRTCANNNTEDLFNTVQTALQTAVTKSTKESQFQVMDISIRTFPVFNVDTLLPLEMRSIRFEEVRMQPVTQ